MMSFGQHEIAQWLDNPKRRKRPLLTVLNELENARILVETPRLRAHCDRLCQRNKMNQKRVTAGEMAEILRAQPWGRNAATPNPPASLSTRVRASEARKIAAGGMRLPAIILDAEHATKLDQLLKSGYAASISACVTRAIRSALTP